MIIDKLKLEEFIHQKKTIGKYIFDEKKKCFSGNVVIVLYLSKINENNYRTELYYFDGYEIGLEDSQKEFYKGNEESAKKMAIESFNAQPELFMGFPIFYSNVSCELC
jgi:hypothetical protein